MTQIQFPSGDAIDFGDATKAQIEEAINTFRTEKPDLFEQGPIDYGTASFEDIVTRSGGSLDPRGEARKKIQTTHPGEVKDLGLQYFVGRGDTDKERFGRLVHIFGEEGVQKVGSDDFVLKLDNISEEVKEKYNLPLTGTMRFNEPGLGWQDVASFLGRETVPLVGALGASIAATGLGFWPGVALVAAAGATGKAIDEFIFEDIFEGLQMQSTPDVLRDVAIQALIEGGGEGFGRGIVAGGKWLLKGRGPAVDSTRVAEFRQNYRDQGYSQNKATKLATRAAREEASALYRQMVEEGANIPAVTLTGKSILGRTQAIWESIFPNEAAVARNVDYVKGVLANHRAGDISTDEAKKLISDTAESMVATLQKSIADPDQAVKQATKELTDVLEKEFTSINKVLEGTTAGSQGLASEFQRGLDLAVKLFTARSNQLYRTADELLGRETINLNPLQDILKSLKGRDAALTGGDKLVGGIWKYIEDTPAMEISRIPALRAALRATQDDPELLGTVAHANVKKMLEALDEGVRAKEAALAAELKASLDATFTKDVAKRGPEPSATPFEIEEGITIFPGRPSPSQVVRPRSPSEIDSFRDGLEMFASANKHYADGAEIMNSGMITQLNTLMKEKNIVDLTGVVDLVVKPNQPQLLKFILDAVKPSGKEVNKIIDVGQQNPSFFAELREQILEGDIIGVNLRLEEMGLGARSLEKAGLKPSKTMLAVPEVFSKLPLNDPTRIRLQNDFAEVLKLYDDLSVAAAGPEQFREGFRGLLAKTWLDNAAKLSPSGAGINYRSLATSFDNLGTKTQNELFGPQANELRHLMGDLKVLDADSVAKLDNFMGSLKNQDARAIVSTFRDVVRQAEKESQDAFIRAMRNGPIDIDKLVTNVLKNPKNFETLRNRVGDDLLGLSEDAPLGNFRDLVLERIVSSGFPTGNVTDDVIKNGSWGQAWLRSMKDLNRNGALDTVLGKETVQDLTKMAKAGDLISDAVSKGKVGLAAAGYSAGFAMGLWLEPISTLTGAASILALSRTLRTKPVMKYLSSPRLRAYEAERALKGGADLGKRNLAAERMRESAVRALRTIIVEAGYYSGDQATNVIEQDIIDPAIQSLQGGRTSSIQPPQRTQSPSARPPLNVPGRNAQIRPPVSPLRQAADPRYQAMQDVLGNP